MPLAAGAKLGPYEIVAPIGAGGMVVASSTQALGGMPMGVEIARDGKAWVYSVVVVSAELYLVAGLK